MNRNVYLSIVIVGIVISILEVTLAHDMAMAYSFFLLTLTVLGFLYIYSEWRYYRLHNAALASSQFLVIPAGLIIIGNFIAPQAADRTIISFYLSFPASGTHSSSTITSILIIFPGFMFINFIGKYYTKQYSGFVFRRSIHHPVKLPLTIHIALLSSLLYISSITGVIDFVVFIFIIWSVVLIITRLAIPYWKSSRASEQISQERRRYVSNILSTPPQLSERALEDGPSRIRRGDIPTRSRTGTRTVNVQPSQGYREVSSRTSSTTRQTRSLQEQPPQSQKQSSRTGQNSRPIAQIDDGISVQQASKPARKVSQSKFKNYLPTGHFIKDDLRCMVCYQEFESNDRANVSICPNCRFPAHEIELMEWFNTSNMCPRCNKNIKSNGRTKSPLKMTEKQYNAMIKKL